ncbi:isopropylmalate/homocitrate/citramalate synthase [Xanthomonas nasturtii]|uniref:Nuclear transport factor 2 family protein n=1 Tax=Xanthomonas nasturtii TaxID=1843581 RepID=A0ABT0LS12_9XANT|nr:nuclear transport factor 2 family protein [Xanthomonas nasturtii]MCL1552140.1 nuclear transport factor 2 family protein [Xanthomonas nasturtii]MCL1556336.1 nuclear transport factor 2 family protein [Xanthomonas nasturtii]OAX87297.1 isopropylmalate/homocitrate/citramalate synthase [Xanthomonas nasturtii]WVL57134.1 nuclear transport factor 2 family protein [Xanthomonas nasturtii]
MSESNRQRAIGLVQAYYDAFNRGDWDAMLVFLADDVAHDLNQGAREIGRAEFAAFLQRMNDSYREQLRDVVITANDDGTRVGAEYVVHGVYHTTDEGLPEATGQTYVLPGGAFFDVQGDKITRVTNYYNLQEWIAQVSR